RGTQGGGGRRRARRGLRSGHAACHGRGERARPGAGAARGRDGDRYPHRRGDRREDGLGTPREEGLPEFEMWIVIHTGEVIVGNIGSDRRMKYAAVGTHVNLTGRIESYTTGGQLLISESTQHTASCV